MKAKRITKFQSKEKIFKPFHKINIIILSVFLVGMIYLKHEGQYHENYIYFLSTFLGILLFWELVKQFKYSYLVKINERRLHYKDDKIVVDLNDIISFTFIPSISYTPSKFILKTKKNEVVLDLPNYNRIKLKKISNTLTENIKRLEDK